jgi:hypothetical protein
VGAEVVEDDDVAWLEGGDEELLDIGAKALAVDRAVEQAGRVEAVVAQRGEEGRGFPMAVRNLGDQALAARRPAVAARHVGLGPGLVDEDQARRIDAALTGAPARAMAAYVRARLLAGDEGLLWMARPSFRRRRLAGG